MPKLPDPVYIYEQVLNYHAEESNESEHQEANQHLQTLSGDEGIIMTECPAYA